MNKETMLRMLSDAHTNLTDTFAATPDDKLNWSAGGAARPALDLFGEAAQTAAMIAEFLETKGEAKPSRELFGKFRAERASWTRADADQNMAKNWARLQTAIEALSEKELQTSITISMHGDVTMTLAAWAMMAYRTFISRFAQINYIQTIYGDTDPH